MNLERVAFFAMALATLISALVWGHPGSYFGNGFETFLAEDVIRIPHKTAFELSVIGHLHIMLALIAVACALIVGRWLDFKGPLHKIAMPMMIAGAVVLSMGVWMVVPFERIAHIIIYVGSGFVMLAALFLVIFGWRKLIRERLAERVWQKPALCQKLEALLHDPLKFGALWQMVFMNFTVSGVGIFMAVKLDEIIRVWPWREERIVLTGHWHILASDHRHHPAVRLRRSDRTERAHPADLRLGDHHLLRPGLCRGDAVRDQTPVRDARAPSSRW